MSMWMITPIKCIMLISESKITSGTNVRFVIQVRLLETTAHALLLPTHYPDLVEYHTHTHTHLLSCSSGGQKSKSIRYTG